MNELPLKATVFELSQQLKNAFRTPNQGANVPDRVEQNADAQAVSQKSDAVWSAKQEAELRANDPSRKIEVNDLKREIADERHYLDQTLKNKLSEYDLPATTQLSIGKDALGKIVLQGPVLNSQLERISFELNQDPNFTRAYNAVNRQKPTLEYVDNVVKLNKAYGSENKIFSSLLSEKQEFNQLKDITTRYQSLQSQRLSSDIEA